MISSSWKKISQSQSSTFLKEKLQWFINSHIHLSPISQKINTLENWGFWKKKAGACLQRQGTSHKYYCWKRKTCTKSVRNTLVPYSRSTRSNNRWRKKILVGWKSSVTYVIAVPMLLWSATNIRESKGIWWKHICSKVRINWTLTFMKRMKSSDRIMKC